ncbi:mitochondrial outer membrane translocase complex, subunit Tom22 [Nemania sp. NC0429]|nr:mitochondrial outer membrane translocase complex, subunit Tom22 [Nemania sp. NC0429]
MVQLQEILDEHFEAGQPGPEDGRKNGAKAGFEDDDADYTDTDSEISEESEYDPRDETLGERLYALRDIVPPQTRGYIANTVSTAGNAVKSVLSFSGKTLWIISSSVLLLGIPYTLAWTEEQSMLDMENEMKMREMGGDLLTAGSTEGEGLLTAAQDGNAPDQQVKAAL